MPPLELPKVDFTRRDSVESMLLRSSPGPTCDGNGDDTDHYCMRLSDLAELRLLEGNDICIDCGLENPEWACCSLGIFMCLECSGQHRALGTHVSKVRSVKMDAWSTEQLELMKRGGNLQCVTFLKDHLCGRPYHSIAERFDCAAAMWYHEILKARRDGREEPTEPPNYSPTRRKEISKAGIGSISNSSSGSSRQPPPSPQQLLESFNNSIQNFFVENLNSSSRASMNFQQSTSSLSITPEKEREEEKVVTTTTVKKKNNTNEVLDKAMGLFRLISTKIPGAAKQKEQQQQGTAAAADDEEHNKSTSQGNPTNEDDVLSHENTNTNDTGGVDTTATSTIDATIDPQHCGEATTTVQSATASIVKQ